MKKKIKKWIKRYLPAEILASVFAILFASVTFMATGNGIISAYLGMIGENIGYYGVIFFRDFRKSYVNHKVKKIKYGLSSILKDIRNIVVEFGFPELLDSIVLRPFFMYIFPLFLDNFALGIFLGKLAADITFYFPTIMLYELRKKYLKS